MRSNEHCPPVAEPRWSHLEMFYKAWRVLHEGEQGSACLPEGLELNLASHRA